MGHLSGLIWVERVVQGGSCPLIWVSMLYLGYVVIDIYFRVCCNRHLFA
jgi:hypothetical protein